MGGVRVLPRSDAADVVYEPYVVMLADGSEELWASAYTDEHGWLCVGDGRRVARWYSPLQVKWYGRKA